MLQQLLHIILVSAMCVGWGVPVLLAWKSSIDKDDFWDRSIAGRLSFLFFSGCIVISLLTSWFGLIRPLHFQYLFIATVVLFCYLIFFKRTKSIRIFQGPFKARVSFSWVNSLFFFTAVLLFVLLSSLQNANNDTQLYHLQVIRWQYEYGAVPGIANLYPRLGLNSNWLNLVSLFYLPFLKNENFTYLNAAFVLWFFIWLFSNWYFQFEQMSRSRSSRILCLLYFLFLLYGLFDWQLFRDAANSTNFDFPVSAFLFIIFSYFIEGIVTGNRRNQFSMVLLLFCFALIGFKFSGIFIFFLIAYYLFTLSSLSKWAIAAVVGLLFLMPIFIRNYITTGYPFFPNTVALSAPDWQVPKVMAQRFYSYILLSNKFYNYHLSFAFSHHSTTFDWIPFWFEGVLLKHKIVFALALLSTLFVFIKPKIVADAGRLSQLIIVLLLMIAGWFFTAPDPGRFGYGMLLTAAFLFLSIACHALLTQKIYLVLLIITTITMWYYIFQKSGGSDISRYWDRPVPTPKPAYSVIKAGEIELHLPQRVDANSDLRCYFTELPCITQENPYLEPRGHLMRQGFRMKPITDSSFILNYNY